MATTLQALKTYYDNVMRSDFAHIPATHQTLLSNLSTQVDAGTLSLAAAQSQVVKLAVDTTSVASLAYNFFTGSTPFSHGFDYLVSAGGPNANNLNSAYYQAFNVDNRYINFALNLGKSGEGATWFNANYGGLTMAQTVSKAYAEIFGVVPTAAKIDELLNSPVPNGQGGTYTRQQYLASYGGDGLEGIGTKAALVGWLLAAAAKEDIGTYAKANDGFLADLAADGVALFRSGLVAGYGTPATGTTGATLTVTGSQSVSPTATDPALKSTANNDTITVTGDIAAGVTIDAGAGRDTISAAQATFGTITTADGGDTLTLGNLRATAATLGVPAQYGTVTLGADNNVVTLKGSMDQGASLTATGTNNVLHVDNTGQPGSPAYSGTISGFQTVYLHSPMAPTVTGATVIYDVVNDPSYTSAVNITLANREVVVLKDTPNAVNLSVSDVGTGTRAEVHLQNFQGAPTTSVSQGPGSFTPNGGAIGMVTYSSSPSSDPSATLVLHVDTDSTAGLIYGYARNTLSANAKLALPNLTIVGAGKLTAQIASNFTNVDATQAGDLNLTYGVTTGVTAQTLRLGDGTNQLNLFFGGNTNGAVDAAPVKVYLGGGVDTVSLASSVVASPNGNVFGVTSLNNLHIYNGVTLNGPPEIIGFQKGVDHLVLDTLAHAITANVQTYADGKTSLQDALVAVSAHVTANTVAVFTWNGDTYVYAQDGTVGVNMGLDAVSGDGLIKLTGVTGLTVGTGAGSYDIHYA